MRTNPSDERLREIYGQARTIAVVGASSSPEKPAHKVPLFLQSRGYRVIPVTPRPEDLFGEASYRSLEEVTDGVDVVNVFRPAEEAPAIAQQAVAVGARVLWLQEGIVSEEAAEIARSGGVEVVMGICMGATYSSLGEPGPAQDE